MENQNPNILDESLIEKKERRRDLLPLWIKIFTWIFIIFGVISPFAALIGVLGYPIDLAIYGLSTQQVLSLSGGIIVLIFLLKGIVAFGLWFEKKWAINLAIFDGIIGIITCFIIMGIILSEYNSFNFRLEILILIPYLITMFRIKDEWLKREPLN